MYIIRMANLRMYFQNFGPNGNCMFWSDNRNDAAEFSKETVQDIVREINAREEEVVIIKIRQEENHEKEKTVKSKNRNMYRSARWNKAWVRTLEFGKLPKVYHYPMWPIRFVKIPGKLYIG